MHGAFSANLDSPARVRLSVVKAVKHLWRLTAPFDFGRRGGAVFAPPGLTETYLILMYVSTKSDS